MPRDMLSEAEVELTPEQKRANWLVELRRQGHRQCVGPFGLGDRRCALYLLHEIYPSKKRRWSALQSAMDVGLTEFQAITVTALNDKGYTFSQIADQIEGWFRG